MKATIDGVTYNTAHSTRVCGFNNRLLIAAPNMISVELYKTPGGEFFFLTSEDPDVEESGSIEIHDLDAVREFVRRHGGRNGEKLAFGE